MAKRGRPAKGGLQPPWMLLRAVAVLAFVNEARTAGKGYEAAIRYAIRTVKSRLNMPISETEVKRILAEFQPEGGKRVLLIAAEGKQFRLREGPRPTYKRLASNNRPFSFSRRYKRR